MLLWSGRWRTCPGKGKNKAKRVKKKKKKSEYNENNLLEEVLEQKGILTTGKDWEVTVYVKEEGRFGPKSLQPRWGPLSKATPGNTANTDVQMVFLRS